MSQDDRNGVMYLLLIVGFWAVVACMGPSSVDAGGSNPGDRPTRTEIWSTTTAPRADVECWRSGHSVVCLPKEKP